MRHKKKQIHSFETLEDRRLLISNGVLANIDDYPGLGSLQVNDRHRCGAALVAPEWILSSAHCFSGSNSFTPLPLVKDVKVKFGLTDKSDEATEEFDIDQLILHPDFFFFGDFDIVLAKLSGPSSYTPFDWARPDEVELMAENTEVTMIGYRVAH